ncbi:acyltransferase family protein [Pseudomonas mosselii]|uniref:acyltransferase family protein n=1 Tax=Pseudomonas mosselii TaxID=78327 RepID=UPI0015E8E54A|nr:acyltransferase [Pseudomonas mosselii]
MKVPLYALTSLRFFAALMVFLSHLDFFENSDSAFLVDFFGSVMKEGYIGVTFFFVLSGFILSYACQGREVLRGGYLDFLISRISRIYPLHFITFIAVIPFAVMATLKRGETWDFIVGLFANITLTQAFFSSGDIYFSFNAPAWSLSVELFFYAVFPVLLVMTTRALLLSVVAVILLKALLASYGLANNGHFLLYIFPPLRLADFMVGILLFRCFSARCDISDLSATLLQAGSIAGLAVACVLAPYVPQGYRYDVYYLLPMAAIVLSFAYNNGLAARLLSFPLLILLGEASFAFYLVHQRVIQVGQMVRAKFGLLGFAYWDIVFSVGCFFVALVVSVLLYRYFEISAKKWTVSKLTAISSVLRNRGGAVSS